VTLTDEQKRQAAELGLTQREASVSLAWRIPLERYAEVKLEIAAERDEWEAKMTGVSDAMLERARYMPKGRGERPATDELSSGEGG
jgi:hypothetical protein